nr:unnamed protein product [Meloidogyne enterolobii]
MGNPASQYVNPASMYGGMGNPSSGIGGSGAGFMPQNNIPQTGANGFPLQYSNQMGSFPGGGSAMSGIDPSLLQQACAAGEQQYCSTQSSAGCTDMQFKYTCPKTCGLCNG